MASSIQHQGPFLWLSFPSRGTAGYSRWGSQSVRCEEEVPGESILPETLLWRSARAPGLSCSEVLPVRSRSVSRGPGREDEEDAIRLTTVPRTYIALLGSVQVSQSCIGTGTTRAVFMTSPAGADSISEHSQVISGAGCNSHLDLLSRQPVNTQTQLGWTHFPGVTR